MARYVITASWVDNDFDLGEPPRNGLPSVDEGRAVDTGLLSAEGHKIMRVADRVGFAHPRKS